MDEIMIRFAKALEAIANKAPLKLYDEQSVLAALYECYNEYHPYDNEQIKADFDSLYESMNGMSLEDMDRIICPVCTLCRDHAKTRFVEGMKIGVRLQRELI